MKPETEFNQIVLMSDEHTYRVMGCYGNALAVTPNLDRLAARGTRFTRAYTPCPICVPARASFATGRYGFETNHWDNASPYDGSPSSWGHQLQQQGRLVESIGKLHYRNADDDVGFDAQIEPMHVVNGIGDLLGCLREPLPKRWKMRRMAEEIGPGETPYSQYDSRTASNACSRIRALADSPPEKPWTLFVSLVTPHFPLIAPQAFYDLFAESGIMPGKPHPENEHPWLEAMRLCFAFENFTPESTRIALASYYALASFMDCEMGKVLDTLAKTGLDTTTQVYYTTDHGDNIGERGFWGKSIFYEESAGIPLLAAGPGIPVGRVCETAVGLTDFYATLCGENAAASVAASRSLVEIANQPDDHDRVVFSEYHAMGAPSGGFMIRQGDWKLVHYVGYEPQLFNLAEDPDEQLDLAGDSRFSAVREKLYLALYNICDPEDVNRRAFEDQRRRIEQHGGAAAILERGGFGATPAPGQKAEFVTSGPK